VTPHPIISSKRPGFWALWLAGRNEFRFFCVIHIFHFWLLACAQKISVCPKSDSFANSGAAAPSPSAPGLYAYANYVHL